MTSGVQCIFISLSAAPIYSIAAISTDIILQMAMMDQNAVVSVVRMMLLALYGLAHAPLCSSQHSVTWTRRGVEREQ